MITDSTKRFSSRVENYVKYRPGYPPEMLDFLTRECDLGPATVVGDIGSGTGKLTSLFLQNGNIVYAVEPNAEMRSAAEQAFRNEPNFRSLDATAETTTLPDHSIGLIVASQAFHWFKLEPTRREFQRILQPSGWVALIWNDRSLNSSPFVAAYEELLMTYASEYRAVNHRNVDATMLQSFFGGSGFKRATFPNSQTFDFAGLKGRLLSSSYAPETGHPNHVPMLNALQSLFDKHQQSGQVVLTCDTSLYYGQLSS